ncbi:MAG: Core component NikM of nickel ECF transporter / Additional substrate-specific component NikN of nickel ECF transporter [uncultured Pseudonocardia sp.]|uniref:Core component NikM of nickel ECF transporter / Additional substrate-specific component NikN of nickel ECF transporter n=1 Tax=uncultured Pseudonocardia sp. TaxID=211455 RepID=A0A6J4QN57_9PSEU|nr:MAG: Core component NikM of nickel ECF transporter / Additional substrate-specific component NikN of nickel ECF transporter [uncultured Pseudonocardia sp.]
MRARTRFHLGFLLVALAIAGGLSYLASSAPDGLDSVTRAGCTLGADSEPTGGECIAQNAREHGLAGSPLADYAVGGAEGSVGLAGVLGVIVTLAVAGGLFWLLRSRPRRP